MLTTSLFRLVQTQSLTKVKQFVLIKIKSARIIGHALFVRLLPEKGGIRLIPTTEFKNQSFDGSPKETPPESACQENPSYAKHGIFPSENVSWKGNGKVGQQDECEQYSQELKAGYQNADIACQTGQKVNRRQHITPRYRSGHTNRISTPEADIPSPQRLVPNAWSRTIAARDAAISRRLLPAANPAFSFQEPLSLRRLRQSSDAAK